MKTRVIDLLNKIAKGEEVPKKIKYNDTTYTYHERVEKIYGFVDEQGTYLEEQYYITGVLNHEVEIIEEDKEIKGMVINNECLFSNSQSGKMRKADRRLLDSNFKEIADKFNEFAKVINELKKGK